MKAKTLLFVALAVGLLSGCASVKPSVVSTAAVTGRMAKSDAYVNAAAKSVASIQSGVMEIKAAAQSAQAHVERLAESPDAQRVQADVQAIQGAAERVTEQLTDTAEKLALATAERAAAQAELVKVQQAVSALEAQETAAIARAQTAVVRQGEIQADRDKIASRLDHLVLWLAAIAGLFVWSGLCQLSGKFQIPPPYSFYGPIAGGALAAAGVAVWLRYFF